MALRSYPGADRAPLLAPGWPVLAALFAASPGAAAAQLSGAAGAPAAPGGSGAHDRHLAFPCYACHGCGGGYEPLPMTFPGGTTTGNGGTPVVSVGAVTSCQVGCHNPIVGDPPETPNLATRVTWDQGAIGCPSCHDGQGAAMAQQSRDGVAYRSSHPVDLSAPSQARAACETCHSTAGHTSGTVHVTPPGGATVPVTGDPAESHALCVGCHDGEGAAIAGRTPPFPAGWFDQGGDFHGLRAGTGWGGTLRAPFARGQGAIPCATCHDEHASGNPYLLRATVNGVAVPPGAIDHAGVGAPALCATCHEGNRHAGCSAAGCHASDPAPTGAACFFCHGHEGIAQSAGTPASCGHCHGFRLPKPEHVPPVITSGPSVSRVGPGSATITWFTNEPASTFVEYGVGAPGRLAGRPAAETKHEVTLTGLSEFTPYVFRVKSKDAMRNPVRSALWTFTTPWKGGPLGPVLTDAPDIARSGLPTYPVTLQWSPVTDPNGDPVKYRVVVDDSPAFDTPALDSGLVSTTRFSASLPMGAEYFWRVQARDVAQGLDSPWSGVDTFTLVTSDPPSMPMLVPQPDRYATAATVQVTLSWTPVSDPNGDPVEYEVEIARSSLGFETGHATGWISATSWTVDLASNAEWKWRLRARDAAHPKAVSNYRSDTFLLSTRPEPLDY
jgi:predicted CXXCH cytochrome family protein